MRLKVKFEGKKGETIRKVFKGTSFNEFEEIDINNYHAINDRNCNKRYQTISSSLDKSIKALGSSVTPTVGTTDNGRKNIGNVRHFLSKKFNV